MNDTLNHNEVMFSFAIDGAAIVIQLMVLIAEEITLFGLQSPNSLTYPSQLLSLVASYYCLHNQAIICLIHLQKRCVSCSCKEEDNNCFGILRFSINQLLIFQASFCAIVEVDLFFPTVIMTNALNKIVPLASNLGSFISACNLTSTLLQGLCKYKMGFPNIKSEILHAT